LRYDSSRIKRYLLPQHPEPTQRWIEKEQIVLPSLVKDNFVKLSSDLTPKSRYFYINLCSTMSSLPDVQLSTGQLYLN
jgi:hypothetical protein